MLEGCIRWRRSWNIPLIAGSQPKGPKRSLEQPDPTLPQAQADRKSLMAGERPKP